MLLTCTILKKKEGSNERKGHDTKRAHPLYAQHETKVDDFGNGDEMMIRAHQTI